MGGLVGRYSEKEGRMEGRNEGKKSKKKGFACLIQ